MEDEHLVDAVEELGQEPRLRAFPCTASRICSSLPPSRAISWITWLPMFEVITTIVLVKSTVWPWLSLKPAVVEDLQEDVEHVAMGLFDFVQQHDRVGPAADGFGQPAAFFVADVARRGADQPADGVPLHELAHVEPDHGVFVVEHHFGQGLAKLGFADAGRARGR